jgi:hypothetical protein
MKTTKLLMDNDLELLSTWQRHALVFGAACPKRIKL